NGPPPGNAGFALRQVPPTAAGRAALMLALRNGETSRGVPVSLPTPLCRELAIDVPILSAGMGSLAGPDLVAAVSEAGGFGVLGVSGASSEVVRERIGRTRALTGRPFGVNVIIDDVGWATSEEDRELVRVEVESAVDEQ